MSMYSKPYSAASAVALGNISADDVTVPDGDALSLAYGLLWLFDGDARYCSDQRVFAARRLLNSLLTRDGQSRGIAAAKALELKQCS